MGNDKKKKLVYISDNMNDIDGTIGGAELNDSALLSVLKDMNTEVVYQYSMEVDDDFLEENKDNCFLVSNFVYMPPEYIPKFYDFEYIIYEHDHKYCLQRNPGFFKDYEVPEEYLVNIDFYKNSKAIFCQSSLHEEIVRKNIDLGEEQIVTVNGNCWADKDLDLMQELLNNSKKEDKHAILKSNIQHKGTDKAVKYCEQNDLEYELIRSSNYHDFLRQLSSFKNFIFIPHTPETLSRIVVEAKMMGTAVIVSKNVGAYHEDWLYDCNSQEVIDLMRGKKVEVAEKVKEVLSV